MKEFKSILDEVALFAQNANQLPQKKDIEILKKVRAVWVVSGSGSYLKPLIDTASDRVNRQNSWYHGLDRARLVYAEHWLEAFFYVLPSAPKPILIYNGVEEQVKDLFSASKQGLFKIPSSRIFVPPGQNRRTLDQIKNFSFSPDLDMKGSYLGVLSHAPHLSRILRFMNKNRKIFRGVKVLVLPLKIEDTEGEKKLVEMEIKGILDYIKKGEAATESYPYQLL